MNFLLLLIYIFICLGVYLGFLYICRNRYEPYYDVDDIYDTDDSTFIVYNTEKRFNEFIRDYTIYTNHDYKFIHVELTPAVECIIFSIICYRNGKIIKVLNIFNEVKDKQQPFIVKLPDTCDEAKLIINECNGTIFENKPLIKKELLWRPLVSSLMLSIVSMIVLWLFEILTLGIRNEYFNWTVLFKTIYPYSLVALIFIIGLAVSFSVIYLGLLIPNSVKHKKAKLNKIKKFKIKKVAKFKLKRKFNKKRNLDKSFIKYKIKKKCKSATVIVKIYDEAGNELLYEERNIKKRKGKIRYKVKGRASTASVTVKSADFKKYYYEFEKFRKKQTKKGVSSKVVRMKGFGIATTVFALTILSSCGFVIYKYLDINAVNDNIKHFKFEKNDDGQTLKIVGYDGKNSVLAIPSYFDGKEVTYIAPQAFMGNKSIKEVHIPNSIVIGNSAFAQCVNIRKLYLASNCHIGDYAFYGNRIHYLDIPSGTIIENGAFGYNTKLKKLIIDDIDIRLNGAPFKGSYVRYLEFNQDALNLTASSNVLLGVTARGGYIFGNKYLTEKNFLSVLAPDSKCRIQSTCVHTNKTFFIKDGKIVEKKKYTFFEVEVEPTCIAIGVNVVTCDYCGEHYRIGVEPNKNNHHYIDGYCTYCGLKDPSYVEPESTPEEEQNKEDNKNGYII